MDRVCVHTLFDGKGRALACGVRHLATNTTIVYRLFVKGGKVTIHQINKNIATIRKIVENAAQRGIQVVTADFKAHLGLLGLSLDPTIVYGVYDLCWDVVTKVTDVTSVEEAIIAGLTRMSTLRVWPWQRLLADAAPVYQALQERGILLGDCLCYPVWSQRTFSGRSKTLGVNLQGLDGTVVVANPRGSHGDLFVHFDWMAADINVAAWLSEDECLREAFKSSDPYTYLADLLTFDRDDCKRALLSAINRLDVSGPLMADVFKQLGVWLASARSTLESGGALRTVLGRVFSVRSARNALAVLNGVFQGSVAHAMHVTVRRVWERFSANLLVEVHDSLAMTCRPNAQAVKVLMDEVAAIMVRPFVGLLPNGEKFFFPVRVSVGGTYKRWQPVRIYREGGVDHVRRQAPQTGGEVAPGKEIESTGGTTA